MSVELVVANYLRIADRDLDGARMLLTARNRNAAYRRQRAPEKIAKAVLDSEGIFHGTEHRNDVLADMVPPENPFKTTLVGLASLSTFATTYRYPKTAGRIPTEPSEATLSDLVRRTADALADAARLFGVDLQAADTVPAIDASPIRADRSPSSTAGYRR